MAKTLIDIKKQIEALEREAVALRKTEIAGVVARIKEAIKAYGLTAQDLGLSGRAGTRRMAAKSRSSRGAKYGDGSGNTWGGRGPRPQWLRDALKNGKTLEDLALQTTAAPASSGKRAAKKSGGKRLKTGKAVYGDGSGKTWTGRGRQPEWFKAAIESGKKAEDLLL